MPPRMSLPALFAKQQLSQSVQSACDGRRPSRSPEIREFAAATALSSTGRLHRSYDMKRTVAAILGLWFFCSSATAIAGCPDDQLQFAFSNLKVKEAFAIFADFAGLKPEIDSSLTQSEPMKFGCTPWRVAAKNLADRHNLSLRIEKGVLHVSKK